jgi:uncharacterized protein (TIGR02466 family)
MDFAPMHNNKDDDAISIVNLFPTPVYIARRDSNLILRERKEIKKIIREGMTRNYGNASSTNTYIFNENLKEIKQFCEHHIKVYVEEVIKPKQELDFYITQSWLNKTEPSEYHHEHSHPNSIISGVFYIETVEDDKITFFDPNSKIKKLIKFEIENYHMWNSTSWMFPVKDSELILFPSWLNHAVEPNEKATGNRISISFNTFVKGTLGNQKGLTELILN